MGWCLHVQIQIYFKIERNKGCFISTEINRLLCLTSPTPSVGSQSKYITWHLGFDDYRLFREIITHQCSLFVVMSTLPIIPKSMLQNLLLEVAGCCRCTRDSHIISPVIAVSYDLPCFRCNISSCMQYSVYLCCISTMRCDYALIKSSLIIVVVGSFLK